MCLCALCLQYSALERQWAQRASADVMWHVTLSDLSKKEALLKSVVHDIGLLLTKNNS